MAGFDAKQVSTSQWLGIGAGVLAFLVSFLPWYSFSFGVGPISQSISANGWSVGFLGWFPLLLLIAAGVIVALPLFGTTVPNAPVIWLGLSSLAFVLILLRLVTYSSAAQIPSAFEATSGFSAGASFGTFAALLVAAASEAGALMTFRATRSGSPA